MSVPATIALVEDDDEIRRLVGALLDREGFTVVACRTAAEFDAARLRQPIDLILLDLMLPGEDGLSLCRRVRGESMVPVLILSARGDDLDRIIGLEVGADDYLPKPFNPRELLARVRALLRRAQAVAAPHGDGPPRFGFAGWLWETGTRRLTDPDGTEVVLTGGEHDLLLCLVEHRQRVLSRDQLLDWTRGRDAGPFDRTIDVQLSRLRRKLEAHSSGEGLIRTIRGGGYLFAAEVVRQ